MPIISGDDRRRFVPQVLVQVLTTLIDELDEERPSSHRLVLMDMRRRLCVLYKLPLPNGPANSTDVAQMMEEVDGLPLED